MTQLHNNWFCDGAIDFEYKKYVLLAYLQYVQRHFKDTKLYPALGELVSHYRNLNQFMERKTGMENGFPKQLEGIDPKKLKLAYKSVAQNDETLADIERLVRYSLPQMKKSLENGKELYDLIEEHLHLDTVGLVPLHKTEGYLILSRSKADYLVYNYVLSTFSSSSVGYRGLQTHFVKSYKRNIVHTLPHIKTDLIRKNKHLPNPATYVVKSEINIPLKETFLPIAKKMLTSHLMRA